MSSEQRIFLPPSSPLSAGALEPLAGLDPLSSPQTEMDSLRLFVTERLTAAVDDILGVFVKTVTRYRDHIDRQQRQLDRLRTEENLQRTEENLQRTEENLLRTEENLQRTEENLWSHEADPVHTPSWIKPCPDDQPPSVHTDGAEAAASGPSAAQIKTEAGAADCGESDPNCDFDPAAGFDAVSDGRLPADCSETEDSGDYWREAAGLWRAEETEEPGGQSSSDPSHQPSPLFTCKVCGESFHRISYLLTHASAHLRDCGLCGKHLDQTENLKLHLRVHREASFRCGVCGQSFTLRGNLRTHMRIHTGERPYSCTVCGKSFGRRATLVRHVRSHTGEKPFVCSYCGRGFVEKGNLTVHLRTHTGEKPYWCSLCDRRFSQLSCFYKHPCQRRGLNTDCPKS